MVDECPYCGHKVNLVDSKIVYGRSYGMIYLCSWFPVCDAYVGVHKGTNKPLGRLANAELREWKKKAHASFDPLWKTKKLSRSGSYLFLQDLMGVTGDKAHIGMFDVPECKKVVKMMESGTLDDIIKRWRDFRSKKEAICVTAT